VAAKKKQQGNDLYNRGFFDRAVKKYNVILDLMKNMDKENEKQATKTILSSHLNIAACHLANNKFPEAIATCDKVLEIDETNVKAFFRRSKAKDELNQFDEAVKDLTKALQFDPSNKDVQRELSKLKRRGGPNDNQHQLIDGVLKRLKYYAENSDPTKGNLIQRFFYHHDNSRNYKRAHTVYKLCVLWIIHYYNVHNIISRTN